MDKSINYNSSFICKIMKQAVSKSTSSGLTVLDIDMEDPFVSAHERQSRSIMEIIYDSENSWAQLLAQSANTTKLSFSWMIKAMSWFAEIAHVDLLTMEFVKAINEHIDEWKLDCNSLGCARFESVSSSRVNFCRKLESFHFGRSLAQQMRIGPYLCSSTVLRILLEGIGDRIRLFCDMNCDEDLEGG